MSTSSSSLSSLLNSLNSSSSSSSYSSGGNTISFSGLGSGMDIQGIVDALVNAEGQPKQQLLQKELSGYNTTLSALGKLKSGLSGIQTAADAFQNLSTFRARSTTVSDTSILTATASSGTALGTYQVQVQQLATADKWASSGFASDTSTVGSGQLSITSGGSTFNVSVAATDTLTNIRDNINAASGNTNVQASIVNVDNGSGGTVSKLVLTSKATGSANAISVAVTDSDGNNTDTSGLSILASNNMTELTTPQDAIITVDGMQVTRSTNTISDAVTGLTLNLNKAQVGTNVSVTVGQDNSTVIDALKTFVKNYNTFQSSYSSLTSYDASSKTAGPLLGDATAQGSYDSLRGMLGDNLIPGATVQNLADIGIQIDKNGVMTLDQTKAETALQNDPTAVQNLLTDPTQGLAARVDSLVNPYLQFGGIFDSREQSLNSQIADNNSQQAALSDRLTQYRASLMQQYTAMDTMVGQMNSTLAYLNKIG